MAEAQLESKSAAAHKKKREEKFRKRDNKSVENILKQISGPAFTPESKLDFFTFRYTELYEIHRVVQNTLAACEKKCTLLQRDKDQLQSEQSKSVLARSRLESLCRELQRQNKLIKDENMTKIREEEERRKEVATTFQTKLSEITNMLQENNEKNVKLRDDNQEMATRMAGLCQEFKKRDAEILRMYKQLDLEKQLSEATSSKLELETKAERDVWNQEREQLQKNLEKSEENCVTLLANMKGLEKHLQMYTGKYQEFESTITKSNEVFDNFKSEMLKMTNQITTLEKELKTWKSRWEKTSKTVVDLTASKQLQDAEILVGERRVEQLQKLCRQLQVDRAAYLKLLKMNGIEPNSQICIEPPPFISATPVNKPTQKEKELAALKSNLKVLQDKFTELSVVNRDAENFEIISDQIQKVNEDAVDVLVANDNTIEDVATVVNSFVENIEYNSNKVDENNTNGDCANTEV